MKVVLINEDNHGQIGVALNYYHAVTWLIGNNWIDDYTEVWGDDRTNWCALKELLGEDWADDMVNNWDIDNFNEFWNYSFQLTLVEVIGTEEAG